MSNFIESIYVVKINGEESVFFIPNYKENKTNIDTLQIDNLKEKYLNPEILKTRSEGSKILDYRIEFFTVNELKLVLASVFNEPAEDMFLYSQPQKVTQRMINENKNRKDMFDDNGDANIPLGFNYYSEFGVRNITCDIKKSITKGINALDTLRDESNYLIIRYAPKNNTIYGFLKSNINSDMEKNNLTQRNVDDIFSLYFPFKNPYRNEDEYKIFMSEKMDIIGDLNKFLIFVNSGVVGNNF